ncbi:hypothetical protein OKW21_002868 [Catalinimonas alkaloidigena]|uniref:porin family protein n=1 Tax=Catalinimonas alkaloidigena TaxID=1075417 RepID=UPI002405D7F5|nr:porin family protein [Catalinimonas alkaloidigena]MDF9797605.1 hypothetical protein [Catalinimonas alkaloidigena]
MKYSYFPMKINAYVVILLFFLSALLNYAHAQILRLGPKAGVQVSRALYDNKEYYDQFNSNFGLGYHAGLVSNVKVSELFSLQTELLYNQVTKRLKGIETADFNQEKYDFISLPVLIRVSHSLGFNQFYFNAGPNVSYWLGGKGVLRTGELAEYNLEELHYTITFDQNQADENIMVVTHPNRFLLGIDVGFGGLLPIQKHRLMLDFRYTFGHTNMARLETQYIDILGFDDDLNYSNHVFSFSCAYLIDFDLLTMSTKGKTISNKKK